MSSAEMNQNVYLVLNGIEGFWEEYTVLLSPGFPLLVGVSKTGRNLLGWPIF
jgi:hypothetical protein